MKLKNRNEIPKQIKGEGVGIEIGTQTGIYAETILANSKLTFLWCLDCWEKQNDYEDAANKSTWRQTYYKLKTWLRLKKFKNRFKLIQSYSNEIPRKYDFLTDMDFVYIDGDHTYQGCKNDLEIMYPRTRVGGIIAGHDYMNGDLDSCKNIGVKKAVDEMVFKYNLKLNVTEDFPPSWWIVKNEMKGGQK